MHRSLLVRLVGLSLAVAVFAIAATAWLISFSTSERLRGEFQRTLEADSFIYQELMFYGQSHESWEDVDTTVAELSERTGRRIALTTPDDDPLADSSATGGGNDAPLPSTPAAEIDPLGMQSVVATTAPPSGMSVFAYPAWRLTAQESEARADLAVSAGACLQELDVATFVTDSSGGSLVMSDATAMPAPATSPAPATPPAQGETEALSRGEGVSVTALPCIPEELDAPSEATVAFNRIETEKTTACLDTSGIGYALKSDERGLSTVMPVAAAEDDATLAWRDCLVQAQGEAMETFSADPAVLYIGSAERFDPFSGGGLTRTALTGFAVLTVATGVTVLAGRRLVQPIRGLTAAAQRMGGGDHAARVAVTGRDEVAGLGHAFNAMAESIEVNERQRRAMVSDIAHELRTPLANVRGYLEAAEDGVVELDAALVTSLLEESTMLQHLIDDLQDLALADAGKLRVHPEERDAAELVCQVVAAHQAMATDAGVELESHPAATPMTVEVDPVRFRQALGNLVSNAVRYTPAGGTVVVTTGVAEGGELVVEVRDDGPGIAAEHLPHVFDRFYRVDGSRSRSTGGSGLGLAITRHLVAAHGGTVGVTSAEGEGSTFTIRLPAGGEPVRER